jgi:hypothetical protein
MKAKMLPVIALCLCMGLSACTRNYVARSGDSDSSGATLDLWLDDTLIPYLVHQFSRHPRFKGQPLLLVRMQGDAVQPRIDDLTDQIRQKIIDELLKQPGIDISWRPAIRPWKHHQRLEDVSCGDYRKIHYYVGIDCGLTKVERHLYVKVRALNLAERKWVSGFGRSWQGIPTAAQSAALDLEHPDEYLRGLRPLPFSGRQPDLLAAYLARNLSCLLRQGEEDDPVVYVENAPVGSPEVIRTTLELMGKYLARFREVEVTDDPDHANITVVSEIHPIHQDLRQIWVSARHRQGEKYLPGAETEAYVTMVAQQPTAVADIQPETSAENQTPLERIHPPSLISSFDLLTPINQAFCATGRPWISGVRRIASRDRLPSGGCLAVEIILSAPAYVFLVGQDADGELTALFPSDCHAFSRIDGFIRPGKPLRFPPLYDPERAILELDDSPGRERVYAIAITEQGLANRFARRLEEHRGLCGSGKGFADGSRVDRPGDGAGRVAHWQDFLNRLSSQYPEIVQWREAFFWHDPPRTGSPL